MFGLSIELITKGKLATVKRFECSVTFRGFRSDEGLTLET